MRGIWEDPPLALSKRAQTGGPLESRLQSPEPKEVQVLQFGPPSVCLLTAAPGNRPRGSASAGQLVGGGVRPAALHAASGSPHPVGPASVPRGWLGSLATALRFS